MNIKYNKKKQELKGDPLVDGIVKAREYIAKNSNLIIGSVVVLLFLIVFSIVYSNMRSSSQHKAQEVFGNAMLAYTDKQYDEAIEQFKIVVTNYGSTSQSVLSSYMLANILFEQGRYDEAITWYESAVSTKNFSGFVGAQAFEGLASCYEAKGDNSSAVKYLEKALNDERISYRHSAIRWKIALLSKSDTSKVRQLCQEIINDSSATDYHHKAENLLAMMKMESAG
ncbi:MAG: tetratricopeptide repeat protein [Fibrobacter sp.]|nr:tetratricopeptide repeat protein [Fibrobacter sp.]